MPRDTRGNPGGYYNFNFVAESTLYILQFLRPECDRVEKPPLVGL